MMSMIGLRLRINMNIKIKLKHLVTISLAVFLSACNNPNNDVPIQSNDDRYENQYQNPPITNTDAIAVGAVGVVTGYALGKYANKPRYGKPNTSYSKPVVVVNKRYYQTEPKVRVSRYKRK